LRNPPKDRETIHELQRTADRESDASLRRKLQGWQHHVTAGGTLRRRPYAWQYSFPRPAKRASGAVRGSSRLRSVAETSEWIPGREPALITVHDRSEVLVREDAPTQEGPRLVMLVPAGGLTAKPRVAELKEADREHVSAHFADVAAGEYYVVFEPESPRDDGLPTRPSNYSRRCRQPSEGCRFFMDIEIARREAIAEPKAPHGRRSAAIVQSHHEEAGYTTALLVLQFVDAKAVVGHT
jgi:hypothetical protein